MTEIVGILVGMLVGAGVWLHGRRYGRKEARERMTAAGLGDTPAVRVRLYRAQWEQAQQEQSHVDVVGAPILDEPNVKRIDP